MTLNRQRDLQPLLAYQRNPHGRVIRNGAKFIHACINAAQRHFSRPATNRVAIQRLPKKPHYASVAYLAATRDEAIERLANLADGTAYPAVRPGVVSETPCTISPEEVTAEFSAITKPLLERAAQNNQQAATLAQLHF